MGARARVDPIQLVFHSFAQKRTYVTLRRTCLVEARAAGTAQFAAALLQVEESLYAPHAHRLLSLTSEWDLLTEDWRKGFFVTNKRQGKICRVSDLTSWLH